MQRFKIFLMLGALCAAVIVQAATVYTRINSKPAAGWQGTYILVYEKSDTEAIIWNGEDASGNVVTATISNGQIISENLANYQVVVTEENTNRYYVKAKNGYIGTEAKKNGLTFTTGGRECTIQQNGSYTMLETNTNTCRFLCYEPSRGTYRFRFYYDDKKKWADSDKHNIHFYVLGNVEQQEPQNQLNINYAHVEMYACESKFPTQSNPYDQYFMTFLFLAQEESDDAVPQVGLEILAPTQYSIEGTYKSDYTPGVKYFLNCQAGSKHSYLIFPNNSEQGWGQAAINLAEMRVTKVGPSTQPNAYVYHIHLEFTDSNRKIWTLDKDLDVYAWWIDCNRQTDPVTDMDPVAFALESGNHNTQGGEQAVETITNESAQTPRKVIIDRQLYILRGNMIYTIQGDIIRINYENTFSN